ncbi:NADPH:quinone oxidoreductase family protein [Amaricoccus solimangrovi]|uniref:NADPH:quinone oxidoreductase family protein n=1 Tax=Amaricoccus solimangrovi TaxID=2589815 RepID=A0A501WM49_9RHOB|nr:NADPH:quinone oxidoreductase family protein [Amaricoccus solimangrovi]TPE48317.1 NADPH:quinone oxidoreductase family protein [Amaricoccus solimangrovi]
MRAMRIETLGEPLTLAEIPRPEPGPGEALIAVRACGVNFADTLMVAGKYQEKPPLPLTPGLEVAGEVVALGPGVTGLAIGARVAALPASGGYADYVACPAERCFPAPEAMPDAEVAGFLIAYGTSHVALAHLAGLRPGERLAVLGAAGGVGLTAVEIGARMGAEVIAIARGAERLAIAGAAGARHLVEADAPDLRDRLRALGGVDVLYDAVGGAPGEAAFRACRPFARILPIGFAGGGVPDLPANILLVKNQSVHGLYFGGLVAHRPEIVAASLGALFAWYERGWIRPHVSHVLPLAEANAALDLLRSRAATGKVVIDTGAA